MADLVEQLRLAGIDVAENANNRRPAEMLRRREANEKYLFQSRVRSLAKNESSEVDMTSPRRHRNIARAAITNGDIEIVFF